jgi:hypothetical protein
VSARGPLARVLLWTVLLCVGALAVVGGLTLRGSGLVAVGVVALLAGSTAAGIAREQGGRPVRSVVEAAVQVTAGTVVAVLAIAGVAALAGGVVATLTGCALVIVALMVYLRRSRPRTAHRVGGGIPRLAPRPVGPATTAPASPTLLPPVAAMSTESLGQEWTRTTALLAGRLDPAARQALVLRREEALDEFERRDPVGFARWLLAGPSGGSNPAAFVRGGPVRRGPVADTDAA